MVWLMEKEFLRRLNFKIILAAYFMDLNKSCQTSGFSLDILRCNFFLSFLLANWWHVRNFLVVAPDPRAQWDTCLLHLHFLSRKNKTKILKLLKLMKETTVSLALEKIFLQVSQICSGLLHLLNNINIVAHCSVTKLCPTLCNPIDCSTPGFPIIPYFINMCIYIYIYIHIYAYIICIILT